MPDVIVEESIDTIGKVGKEGVVGIVATSFSLLYVLIKYSWKYIVNKQTRSNNIEDSFRDTQINRIKSLEEDLEESITLERSLREDLSKTKAIAHGLILICKAHNIDVKESEFAYKTVGKDKG